MTAICDTCGWTGGPLQVADRRCPECNGAIRYESKPLESARQLDTEEFNTRALAALKGTGLFDTVEPDSFMGRVSVLIRQGLRLTPAQQRGFVNTVLRYADQITDRQVNDFAVMQARGAD